MPHYERDGTAPIDLLQRLLEIDPEFAVQIQENQSGILLPQPRALNELIRHPEGDDPDELIRHRFLCRGAAAVVAGPTGAGKSSFTMQCALSWAVGRPCLGLEPARPLRTLIVQAENDDGDLAEMRDGVLAGMDLPPEERARALANVHVLTEDSRTREAFARLLDQTLLVLPKDLAIADPALAYIGGDASAQREVTPFLRNMINPVIHRHRIGFMMVHHFNKPPSGEQKPRWQAGDFAYLGAGSAEFGNWARAVIAIRSIGSETIFELRLGKRGRRARWRDANGQPTNSRYIAYHREPGVISWREPDACEIADLMGGGRPTIRDVVDALGTAEKWKKDLTADLEESTGLKKTQAYELVSKAIEAGAVRIVRSGSRGAQLLRATGSIPPRPPVTDDPGAEGEPSAPCAGGAHPEQASLFPDD